MTSLYQEAAQAPLRIPAEAAQAVAKAEKRVADARYASDQAAAEAAKMEADAKKALAEAETITKSAPAEIAKIKAERGKLQQELLIFIGPPLPSDMR